MLSTVRYVTQDWRIVHWEDQFWLQHGWLCLSAPDGWTGATLTVGAVRDRRRLWNPKAPWMAIALFRSERVAEAEIGARIAAEKKSR